MENLINNCTNYLVGKTPVITIKNKSELEKKYYFFNAAVVFKSINKEQYEDIEYSHPFICMQQFEAEVFTNGGAKIFSLNIKSNNPIKIYHNNIPNIYITNNITQKKYNFENSEIYEEFIEFKTIEYSINTVISEVAEQNPYNAVTTITQTYKITQYLDTNNHFLALVVPGNTECSMLFFMKRGFILSKIDKIEAIIENHLKAIS